MSSTELYPTPDLPDGWEKIDHLCYPRQGSKGYKRQDGANAHIINMYDTGAYIVQIETSDGVFHEERVNGYDTAIRRLEAMVDEVFG